MPSELTRCEVMDECSQETYYLPNGAALVHVGDAWYHSVDGQIWKMLTGFEEWMRVGITNSLTHSLPDHTNSIFTPIHDHTIGLEEELASRRTS